MMSQVQTSPLQLRAYYDDVSGFYWLLFIQPTFTPIILSRLTHADSFISHDCTLCS